MNTDKKTSEKFNKEKKVLSNNENQKKLLRFWPAVVIVLLQWLLRYGVPIVVPGDMVMLIGVFGGFLGGIAVVVWWGFFSRAPKMERWGAIILMIVAIVVTPQILHESIVTGNVGLMYLIYVIPVLSLFFVVWAVASRKLSDKLRRITMVATIIIACGLWSLLRSDGISGGGASADFSWRWSETAEERLLSKESDEPIGIISDPSETYTGAIWPGFRGLNRDGNIHGIQIKTDWSSSPPVEMWRRPIGPACSSFAVMGNLFYTQEQRGEEEMVSCYNLNTGEPIWRHSDAVRFWDSHAGAGPRSTPTLSNGRVYTFGATGMLNVLNASDGSLVWSRNAASDTDVEILTWAYTSSPLVIDDIVIVAISGLLAAYDIETGDPRWFGPDGGESYSSPHLYTIDGVTQVLLMSGAGVTSLSPSDGKLLWQHSWPIESRIVQPALTADGDILISRGVGKGMRRISVSKGTDGWNIQERWTSIRLRPNFNDFNIHKGYAYGFDGPSIACIDIENGERMWKGGRYMGFNLLLADQNLLIILSEKGEIALVEAVPDKYTELARIHAVKGKTWNHPALAGNILLVRNAQEMVAFRLALAND